MTFSRRRFLHLAAGAAALPAAPHIARAQTYPTRPITLIVPFGAGGPTDVMGRIIAEHMSRTLGQRLIVENVAGAGGTTATNRGMRAAPDGYTIQLGHMGTHATAPAFYPNLAYRPDADFAPIGMVALTAYVIAANKNVPTSREAGLPEFQVRGWNGLFAPKGTPRPILDQLTEALDRALDDETTRKRLFDIGSDIPEKVRRGQDALAALVKSEIARWTPIIKGAQS